VRQTDSGADIDVHMTAPVDLEAIRTALADDLSRLGICAPRIEIAPVQHIERQRSGKLKRFIPLSGRVH
jgi:hypothetical protein